MVAVELVGNYIDAEPMQARHGGDLIKSYQSIWYFWKATGIAALNWYVMDNEALVDLKQAICENGCTVEMTPPDIHRRNIAERAMQAFKNFIIAILAGLDGSFLIHQWVCLLPKVIL